MPIVMAYNNRLQEKLIYEDQQDDKAVRNLTSKQLVAWDKWKSQPTVL